MQDTKEEQLVEAGPAD
jgi:hypothetical protein